MNTYGVWQSIAVVAASGVTLAALALGRQLNWRSVLAVVVALMGGLVGARLLKVAFDWSEAVEDPSLIWTLDFRGLDLAGVVLGGLLAGSLTAGLLKLPRAELARAAVPGLAIGMSLSKVGCWAAGCCFGKVYAGVGAVSVAKFSDAHLAQIGAGLASPFGAPLAVFPIQLIEVFIPMATLAWWLVRDRGRQPLEFLAVYGVLKALATLYRFPDAAGDPPLMHLALYFSPVTWLTFASVMTRRSP